MPSPFPGMNPWLENAAYWQNFHNRYLAKLCAVLDPLVAPNYFIEFDQEVLLTNFEGETVGRIGPDIQVSTPPRTEAPATIASAQASTLVDSPAEASLGEHVTDPPTQSFLEIRTKDGERIVTVIEVLSPSNKRMGPDRDAYEGKRRSLLHGWTNLVEIDLLRGFGRMGYQDMPGTDYAVGIMQPEASNRVAAWPIGLRSSLPTIPIPLDEGDPPVHVDLQQPLHDVYDEAGFHRRIYRLPPSPPLSTDDAAWAAGILKEAGVNLA